MGAGEQKTGLSKEMWGCLGTVLAAAVTGCFALLAAWNAPERIAQIFDRSTPTLTATLPAPPTETPVPPQQVTPTPFEQSRGAQVENVWVDYDVTENNQFGMRIHLQFSIWGYKDMACMAVAYFHYNSGAPLRDLNGAYADAEGNVASWNSFRPGYDDTDYSDWIIFIPYDEFHLDPGAYELKYVVRLFTEETQEKLADTPFYAFTFTKNP